MWYCCGFYGWEAAPDPLRGQDLLQTVSTDNKCFVAVAVELNARDVVGLQDEDVCRCWMVF